MRGDRNDGGGLFVSWIRWHGRSAGIADALGLSAQFVAVGKLEHKVSGPARHAIQAAQTAALLLRQRPPVLVVMAPPTALVVVAVLYRVVSKCRLAIDAHSGAVVNGRGAVRRLFLHLAKFSDLVIVTNEPLAAMVRPYLAHVAVLHDRPLTSPANSSKHSPRARPLVLFPSSWASDEPLDAIAAAAAFLPDVDFAVTGQPRGRAVAWPANVRLAGYLDRAAYDELLVDADCILALTTREMTMQRAGYEALAARKPLVCSDTSVLREFFGDAAVFTSHVASDLAGAVRRALSNGPSLSGQMDRLAPLRLAEFDEGLSEISSALSLR